MSVRLARAWNITLCGYARRRTMNVYSHPERLGLALAGEARAAVSRDGASPAVYVVEDES